MKKKIIFLSSLMVATNLGTVVSCSNSSLTLKPEIIVPNSYDLSSELLELNQLDFKKRNSDDNLNNYLFLNSWFVNFKTNNKNKVFFEGKKIAKDEKKLFYSSWLWGYHNGGSLHQTWIAREETNGHLNHKNWGKLVSISSIIDLNQTFQIESLESGFSFGETNSLSLTNKPEFIDYEISPYHLPEQKFHVGPYEKYTYEYDLFLYLHQVEGLLKFRLDESTELAYQVENKLTHEKSVYFYKVNDLINNYELDYEYKEILVNSKGFFYYDKQNKVFNLQLKAEFNLVDNWVSETSKFEKVN